MCPWNGRPSWSGGPGNSYPGCGVTGHRAVPPKARGVATVTAHVGDDRHAPGQTNLAAMGVTREIKAEAGARRDFGQFRGMDEGNLEAVGRGLERRPGRVRIVVVNVVGSGHMDLRRALSQTPGLVDEHIDTQVLKGFRHVGAVVVAEDGVDPIPGPRPSHESFECG